MSIPDRQQLIEAMAGRAAQLRIRLALATLIAPFFHTYTGWQFALGWWLAYVAVQALERRLFPPAELEARLSTPAAGRAAVGVVALNNVVFCSFGVAEIVLGGPWGVAAGALLICGAIVHAVLTGPASGRLFIAAVIPPILAFLALPLTALATGAGGLTASQMAFAAILNVVAALMAWRMLVQVLTAENEARRSAEAANRAKSTFLATMSHEIRTPLNGVLGMAQVLASEKLSPLQRDRVEVIRRSGETLLAILNDVLDLSKIEAGKLELEVIDFSVTEVAAGAHAAFTALANKKGLSFDLAISDAAKGVYRGDPTRLRQILYNLISNALKFTEAGEVRVVIDRSDGGLTLVVSDTGIGMPAESVAKLFEKFEQGDASTTRRFGGTGLGLAICRELVQLMDGDILAESQEGRGTQVRVSLPLARVADERQRPAARQPGPAAGDEVVGGLRVLAAEDNEVNQLVLKTLLHQAGLEPVIVGDGAAALEAWREGHWDVILMDVQMPVMDGLAAARAIRREEAEAGRPHTPIIALTANAMSHQVAEYQSCGMDGFVAKPIQIGSLFEALQAALDPAEPARRAAI